MIKAYSITNGSLTGTELEATGDVPQNAVWIDMIEPTVDEDSFIEKVSGVSIPTRAEMRDIEESSRLYAENGAIYMTAPVLFAAGTDLPGIAPVTFVLTEQLLITVRYTSPNPFKIYASRAAKPGNELIGASRAPLSVLFGLVETITDRIAELLEDVTGRLDIESQRLTAGFGSKRPMTTGDFRSSLAVIGKEGDFLSKARESLAGIGRLLAFVASAAENEKGKARHRSWLKSLERDVNSLNSHVSFLSDRTVFLLDTVVGMVSVEQNAIIKIFSVAAVIFMPPTLVASIYGMNFEHMPELDWMLGYPMAVGAMVISALIPLLYFRYRRWL